MYHVVEYRFNTEAGYEFAPVTTPRSTRQDAEKDRAVIERRYREHELDVREDYEKIETCKQYVRMSQKDSETKFCKRCHGCGSFTSKLERFGKRLKTRLFAVRKGDT